MFRNINIFSIHFNCYLFLLSELPTFSATNITVSYGPVTMSHGYFETILSSRCRLINEPRSSLEPPEGTARCLWCASRGVNEATMTSIIVSFPITHPVNRAKHICICKTDHHWLKYWLVACSAPSHYLNQWWHIVDRSLEITPQWYLYQTLQLTFKKMNCSVHLGYFPNDIRP